ncbi:uncharacterized protein RCC_06791 [Ramularia collo-cygni]|uniref:DUF6604 domain-containing protein n=1 Tax=Ramularia collo-cygni TaxID=112498 RepID=A0A2D3V667_9PEZI|nr:uncharacterized protein RCC_06791 [Ramularia collo-cygni]CZT20930.1 uncharacterized protein RCC_06791 [Ramularia collo-cygni]
MAPNATSDMYTQYKAYTNEISTWLGKNADRCNITVPVTPGKPKSPYPISQKQYKVLATSVAQSTDPIIVIDTNILSVIRLTIELRKKAIPRLAKINAMRAGKTYNQFSAEHYHFVKILEEVLDILESVAKARSEASNRKAISFGAFYCAFVSGDDDDFLAILPDTERASYESGSGFEGEEAESELEEDQIGYEHDEDGIDHELGGDSVGLEADDIEYELEGDEFERLLAVYAIIEDATAGYRS